MPDVRDILASYISGPAHVGFVVEELDAAVDQACRVYGIDPTTVRYEPPAGVAAATRFAFFAVAGLEFEYIEPCTEEFRDILLGMPSGGGGINHVAWAVTDIEAAVALLASHDIHPGHVTPGGVISIGEKKMVYLDPATTGGLVIELIQYPGA